jgi:hypothetical protein
VILILWLVIFCPERAVLSEGRVVDEAAHTEWCADDFGWLTGGGDEFVDAESAGEAAIGFAGDGFSAGLGPFAFDVDAGLG